MAENKKSLIWEYFEASSMSATCKLCKKASKRSHGNTSNLTAHFKEDHRHEHQAMQEDEARQKMEADVSKEVPGYYRILLVLTAPTAAQRSICHGE